MRTKTLLIASSSVLLLVAAGFALAKGKPPKLVDYGPFLTTFSDSVGDAVQSDGGGPYSTVMHINRFNEPNGFVMETGERTIFMDLSQCISESCETFFDPETSGETAVYMKLITGIDVTAMQDGEVTNVIPSFKKQISRKEWWVIEKDLFSDPVPTLTASDTTGDGTVDSWEITSSPDNVYVITHCQARPGPGCIEKGRVSIPFTLTVESDQN